METNNLFSIEQIINLFETELRKQQKGQDSYHVVIMGELHRNISYQIEDTYKDAGWKHVHCCASSEKGQRPGLTELRLSMNPLI